MATTVPTPGTVAIAAGLRAQREASASLVTRRERAARAGYRGTLTRRELAAAALVAQRQG